tara:strand:+ start:3932 stop:4780 length:849 start_codon:yes stop_codon:yes gene_type:complete
MLGKNRIHNLVTDIACRQQIRRSLAGKHDHLSNLYKNQLPNFIIIGAAKSATTSLVMALKRHPDILISKSMEPKFFGRHYIRGWDWYANQFREGEQFQLRGEASTMYSSSYGSYQHTPQLIRHHLGTIPLIYLVRHPLRRIESHWRHWRGRVECEAFNHLLTSEKLKQRLIDSSLYNKQLKRYRRWFPRQSILCITTEELTTNPRANLQVILNFLGTETKLKKMLNHGQLPLANIAGSKGRQKIDPPEWPGDLKEQIIKLIKPDTEAFLRKIQRPSDTWEWN